MKNIIITAVITTVVLVEAYFVYEVVTMHKQVTKNTTAITQIVDFLNKQIEKTPQVN